MNKLKGVAPTYMRVVRDRHFDGNIRTDLVARLLL